MIISKVGYNSISNDRMFLIVDGFPLLLFIEIPKSNKWFGPRRIWRVVFYRYSKGVGDNFPYRVRDLEGLVKFIIKNHSRYAMNKKTREWMMNKKKELSLG